MARFYPPEDPDKIESMQSGGHLFCIDWKAQQHKVYGSWRNPATDYSYVDVMLVPCATTGEESCEWDKTKVKEYLGSPWNMIVYHNQQKFEQSKFDDESIENKSVLTYIYTAAKSNAMYTDFFVNKNQLKDEVQLVQLGQSSKKKFIDISNSPIAISKWDEWPDKDSTYTSEKLYKFNSVTLNLNLEINTFERQTYSLLELISDIGGLFDGLCLILAKIIAPIAALALQSELLTNIFRQEVTKENHSKVHQRAERIILPCCIGCRGKKNRHRNMVKLA